MEFLITSLFQGKIEHQKLLPRTFCRSTEEGQNFKLVVFVNDVSQDVTEGSDGVEHMYVV